jgi:5-methylcytosine-specific restriction endonuclease McrA
MNKDKEILERLRELRAEYGTSYFDHAVKKLMRERLDVRGRPSRKRYRWSEYKTLYTLQGGNCGICEEPLQLIRGKISMDHKNPNLTGEEFEARWNRQVVHPDCNSAKNADSIPEQAKKTGKPMTELV